MGGVNYTQAYWVDTSSNDLVIEFLSRLDREQRDDIWELYRRGTVNSKVNTAVSYQQLDSTEADIIFSLMAMTGYLKPVRQLREDRYLLALPNREIQTIFNNAILRHIKSEWKIKDIELLGDAIALGDTQELETQLRRYLKESLSYFDNREAFYHGWMMGISVRSMQRLL